MVKLHRMCVNKDALKTHLINFSITNHFNYKVRTSHKEWLHAVCLDDKYGWIVCATKVEHANFFQMILNYLIVSVLHNTIIMSSLRDTIRVSLFHDTIIMSSLHDNIIVLLV